MTDGKPGSPSNAYGYGNGDGERLISYRVNQHELWIREIRDAVKEIASSLQVLADVQRRLNELEGAKARLDAIEQELPTLKLARKWVLMVMTSGGAAVGAGVLALVVK